MRPLHAVVVGAIGLAFVAAGCGGAVPSSDGGPATLKLASSMNGRYLVDNQGHTLYLFEKDDGGESYCNGACAAVWPPLETSSSPQATGGGLDASALGTITRDDGEKQVTYHGHPLYYYAADASSPGKTKGEDVDQFGSSWYLVNAGGSSLEPKSSESKSGSNTGPSSTNTGTTSNGGGGY